MSRPISITWPVQNGPVSELRPRPKDGTVLVQEQPAQLSQLWSLQGSRHSETTAGTFVGECNRCSFVQLL